MRFKRICSVAAAICLCCNAAGVTAFAAAEHDTKDVKVSYDFETGLEFSTGCAKRVDTGNAYHKYAMEISPTEAVASASKKFSGLESGEKTTVSFDFMAKQTDHIFRLALHDGTKVYSSIYWDHAGRMLFSLNGQEPAEITKTNTYSQQQAIEPYNAERWHNVSFTVNPNGADTVIDYYYDGVKVGSGETSRSETGELAALYFTSTIAGYGIASTEKLDYDSSEKLYIDNLRISQGDFDLYATAEDYDGFVKAEFSAQISKSVSLDDIRLINTTTKAETEIKEIVNEGRNLYILPEEELVLGNEYIIEFPRGMKSADGRELCNPRAYFTARHGVKAVSWKPAKPYVFDDDFEDLDVGAAVKDDKWDSVIATGTIAGISCKEEDGNRFIRFENTSGASYLRFESSGRWSDSAVYDRAVVEFDVSMPEVKRSSDILFLINSKTVGQCFFDSFGRFVAVSGSGFNSGEDTDGEYPDNHIVYELSQQENQWYRLSCRFDKKEKTIDYYINDEFAGSTVWTEDIKNPSLTAVRVKANTSLGDGRAIDFDNFLVAHTKSCDTVSKLRLYARNAEAWGAFAEDVPPTVAGGRVEFSCNIDSSAAQAENIIITGGETIPVTITGMGNNYLLFSPDGFLKADTEYTLSVSGIVSDNGIPLADYSASFKTSAEKSVEIENFRLENSVGGKIVNISDISAGTEVVLKADIVNSTDNDILVRPILTQSEGGKLMQTAEESVYVAAGEAKTASVGFVSVSGTNTTVSAMLTDENYAPLCSAVTYSNTTDAGADKWTAVYEGKLKSEKSGEQVFVDVLLPGKTRADIGSVEILDTVLAYRAQVVTGADGTFGVRFRLEDNPDIDGDAVSGSYAVLYSAASGHGEDALHFSNPNHADELAVQINSADKAAIKDIIENNPDALAMEKNAFSKVNPDKLAQLVYNTIKKEGVLADGEAAKQLVNRCMYSLLTADGAISNLFGYAAELGLDSSKIKGLYTMGFVIEELQREITSELRGKAFDDIGGFYDALTEKFVLNTVEHPDGINNIKTVFKALYAEIPLNLSRVNDAGDAVYSKLSYRDFESYKKLADAFNDAYGRNDAGGGSGGGGTGGGTTSGGVSASISTGATLPQKDNITSMPPDIFDDIENVAWAKDAIISLAEKRIISGRGENKFCPNDNITREEFTALVANAFLSGAQAAGISFSDIGEQSWSYSSIAKAYGAKVISGYSDVYFGAKENITRQDMASILYRAAIYSGTVFVNSVDKRFADEASIPEYALEAVNVLYNAGVVSGTSDAEFDGASFATRAQAAKMIYELLKL